MIEKFNYLKEIFSDGSYFNYVTEFSENNFFAVHTYIPNDILRTLKDLKKNINIDYELITLALSYRMSKDYGDSIKVTVKIYRETSIEYTRNGNYSIKGNGPCFNYFDLYFMYDKNKKKIKLMQSSLAKCFFIPFNLKKFQRVYLNALNNKDEKMQGFLDELIFSDFNNYFANDIKSDLIKGLAGISYDFNKMKEFHNRKELLMQIGKIEENENVNYLNKMSLQKGYALILLKKYVEERHFDYLKKMPEEFFNEYIRHPYILSKVKSLLSKYYIERLSIHVYLLECDKKTLKDYIDMKIQLKQKIPLNICSIKKLESLHNQAALDIINKQKRTEKEKLNIGDKFKNLIARLPEEYEVIDDSARLKAESIMQNNCVASYKERINKGRSLIVSYLNSSCRYTIEVIVSRKKYQLAQFLGKCNRQAPRELIDNFEKILVEANTSHPKSD